MRWISWDQKLEWFKNTALDHCMSIFGYQPRTREILAQHAAAMTAQIKALRSEAISHVHARMKDLHHQNYFPERWITLIDPWQEPELKLLHDFGSLPNVCAKFGKAAGPNVR